MSYQLTDKDVEVLNQMRNDVTSLVRRFGGNQPPGSPRYYPGQNDGEPLPPLYPVVFKISSNASGGGKYYGKVVYGVSSATGSGDLAESDNGTVNSTETLLCLNMSEISTSTHLLQTNRLYTGVIVGLDSSSGKMIVSFSCDVNMVRFKITSAASGGGKYYGKSFSKINSVSSDASNLTEADLGSVSSTEDLVCYNVREVGKSTHDISTSTYLPLVFVGYAAGQTSGGKGIVVFDGFQWKDC